MAGFTSFVASTLSVVHSYFLRHNENAIANMISSANGIVSIFAFIWLIVGSVYVYEEWKPNYAECNKTVYLFAFISITCTWSMAGLGILIGCLCCVCVALTKKTDT